MTDQVILNDSLEKYNRYILNRIIDRFAVDNNFNIYELVNESVSYKCILPSQNALVMETYYAIKEYLLMYGFVIEKKEMTVYSLTEKGKELKSCGTLEKYEQIELNKGKSLFHKLFFKNKSQQDGDSADNFLVNNYG